MNKKRYWLKFGLIFGVVALVASIPGIFMMFGFGPNILGGHTVTSISLLIILPVQFPTGLAGLMIGGRFFRDNLYLVVIILALIPSIFYFIVGVIIGGIYGKIKNRYFSTDLSDTINTYTLKKVFLFCLLLIIIGLTYSVLVSREIYQRPRPTFIIQ